MFRSRTAAIAEDGDIALHVTRPVASLIIRVLTAVLTGETGNLFILLFSYVAHSLRLFRGGGEKMN